MILCMVDKVLFQRNERVGEVDTKTENEIEHQNGDELVSRHMKNMNKSININRIMFMYIVHIT
jgi:hypothetical protein